VSQQTQTTEAVKPEVLDQLPAEAAPLVVREDGSVGTAVVAAPVDMNVMREMGFITPIATPEQLRAAFAYKQQMYAAILDPSDYLYTVTWMDGKRQTQRIMTNFDEAKALAEKFKHLGAMLNAKPKKSGIVKLARALGITASRKSVRGLPEEPAAQYSYVEYEALHEGTGKSEIGVGWCDKGERGGKISTHDVIATADTRAYNRAVMRLAGFGEVSADEIIAGASDSDDDLPQEVPQPPKQKAFEPLPGLDDEDVLTASRTWAEALRERKDGIAPTAKQDTRSARELRGKARRGDAQAARKLGALGLAWEGTGSDGLGYQPFTVEKPPVAVKDLPLNIPGTVPADPPKSNGTTEAKPKGWDLSGKGSDKDDTTPVAKTDTTPSISIPQPSPTAETVTLKQAKNVSLQLKSLFSTIDEMQGWLKEHCGVTKSTDLRLNQYEATMSSLSSLNEKKES
jgi:hypothetical protein